MVTVMASLPVTPLRDAEKEVEPAATPEASPAEVMVATAALVDAQATVEVTFAVPPLLYVAVAVNCCVAPMAKLAVFGVIAIEVRVGFGAVADTVSIAVPGMLLRVAVIVVEPFATAVASPVELIVAADVVEDVQATAEVTFPVLPSL